MSFKDIVGQDKPVSILQNALAKNRLAHAYLFYGHSGVGKVLTALNFAKAVNCLNRPDAGVDCCDECVSCKKIDAGNHMDVSVVKLLKDKSHILIEQIRQLQSQVNLRPYEAKYKVFIIQDAECANDEAQSALLKTLEEPPVKSIIILTTSNPEALLTTIISRCQSAKFYPLNVDSSLDILVKRFALDKDAAFFLAHIAQSGLVDISKYAKPNVLENKNKIIADFNSFLNNPGVELSFLKAQPEEIPWILSVLLWWYRDMLIFKETGKPELLANKDRLKDLSEYSKSLSVLRLGDIISSIMKTSQILSETNVSAKLALTVMATDILS